MAAQARENAFVPTPLAALAKHVVIQVSAGAAHSTFVTQAGDVFCTGDDGHGQLGLNGTRRTALEPTPPPKFSGKKTSADAVVLGASAGGSHTAFLLGAVVDERSDLRSDQIHAATSTLQKWFRGSVVRRHDAKAKERRKHRGPLRKHHRKEAAVVIQTAWRQHVAAVQFGERLFGEGRGLEEHGWARVKRQFLAAIMMEPMAKATRIGAVMPKADW